MFEQFISDEFKMAQDLFNKYKDREPQLGHRALRMELNNMYQIHNTQKEIEIVNYYNQLYKQYKGANK